MDEFYTDAQYGNDFGYYSTGRVLGKSDGKSAQEFAHYTTYPMALSPHFGRVLCRVVFIMWLQMNEKAPFRVVEIGAGSGQLAHDIQECVKRNELGIDPPVWRRRFFLFEPAVSIRVFFGSKTPEVRSPGKVHQPKTQSTSITLLL
ncbi:unnamed protein product [Durusdinium trenchii]|uniref:type II protein arginine methyltransferase n=1 Tax=Durusdinium trenchii TaxID=1381693 RepID=A0ABP0PCM4_9DINO